MPALTPSDDDDRTITETLVADRAELNVMFGNAMRNMAAQPPAVHMQGMRKQGELHRLIMNDPVMRAEFEAFRATQVRTARVVPVPEPTATTLPVPLTNALLTAKKGTGSPKLVWARVADLPAFPDPVINFISYKTFEAFAPQVDHGNIVTVNDFMNGTATTDRLIAFLEARAQKVDDMVISYERRAGLDDEYAADIRLYDLGGVRFKVVDDFAGRYVYAWPKPDENAGHSQLAVPKMLPPA